MIRPEDIAAMHARRLRDVDIFHRTTNLVVAAEWRMASTALLYTGTVATAVLIYLAVRDQVERVWAASALIVLWAAIIFGAVAIQRRLKRWAGQMRAMADEREDAEMARHLAALKEQPK